MTKINYTASLDGQIVGKRSSDRTYTHAIVVMGHGKGPSVATWCGRLDLAQGEKRKAERYGYTAVIVPAEIAEKAPKAARQVEAIAKPDADPAPAAKPELCYIVALGAANDAKRVCIVKRGESGYFATDFDTTGRSAGDVAELVDDLNARLGVDRIEARCMLLGSMFGWDVAAANSDHQRDALAEAQAIADSTPSSSYVSSAFSYDRD